MKYIVGNWKMNQSLSQIAQFLRSLQQATEPIKCAAWVAPQFVHIPSLLAWGDQLQLRFWPQGIAIGGQNCSQQLSGAFTGEVSAMALKELGCGFVIVGHSERRQYFREDHPLLREKLVRALAQGLHVIYCVGETLQEREGGQAQEVVGRQLQEVLTALDASQRSHILLAYEPVWAIGTGKTATAEAAQEMHGFIRQRLQAQGLTQQQTPILYGGSVKPENLESLLTKEDIDGALVGGASLIGEDFLRMCLIAGRFC